MYQRHLKEKTNSKVRTLAVRTVCLFFLMRSAKFKREVRPVWLVQASGRNASDIIAVFHKLRFRGSRRKKHHFEAVWNYFSDMTFNVMLLGEIIMSEK